MIASTHCPGSLLLAAAQTLVGSPFRLHGRDPATGLDCAGLVVSALKMIGRDAPPIAHYSRHWQDLNGVRGAALAAGLVPAANVLREGDVLVMRVSPVQLHLVIAATASSAVHAHAGLGRVVQSPLPADWALAAHFRLPHQ